MLKAGAEVKPLRPNEWALLKIVVRYGNPWVDVDTFKHHFGSIKPLIKDLVDKELIIEREKDRRNEHSLQVTRAGQLWYLWQKELDK